MMIMKRFLWLAVSAFILVGCGRKTAESTDGTNGGSAVGDTLVAGEPAPPTPIAADHLFDDFFFSFCSNPELQSQRVVFPLPVYDAEGTRLQMEREQWNNDPFFIEDGYYTVIFDTPAQMEAARDTSLTRAVVERINLDADFVSQYLFSKEDNCWMLTAIQHQAMSDNHNASFLTFYQRFAADSTFQEKSLSPRVKFTTTDPDDEFSTISGTMVPAQWDTFRPAIIPQETIYNIVYGQPAPEGKTKYFIIRGVSDDMESQMLFRKSENGWKLTAFTN